MSDIKDTLSIILQYHRFNRKLINDTNLHGSSTAYVKNARVEHLIFHDYSRPI